MLIGNLKLIKMVKKNNLIIRDMYVIILLSFIMIFFSCQEKNITNKEKLIGKWESTSKNHSLIKLEISKNYIIRFENGNKIIYNSYSVSGDTLLMSNKKLKEKHLIEILTDKKIRFGAVHPYEKDIELLDAVEFKKK